MKHIVKQPEPGDFVDWKAQANEDWQPTYAELSGDTKKSVKDSLMSEQGYICCYCEQVLVDRDSHIEHLVPQSRAGAGPLDYSNLLCSCQRSPAAGEPRHCGNLKGSWYSPDLMVSPLDSGCESRFSYLYDGHIKPRMLEDEGAAETIARLGLDIPKLVAMRSAAIAPFMEKDLSYEDVKEFAAKYLHRDSDGRFKEFWTTIDYLFS